MITLKGMTWDHSRGYTSVVATSQRYTEINPSVQIDWDKRSLKDFGDFPIDKIIDTYDLIVLDHPSMGFAHAKNLLLPLQDKFSGAFLADQKENSVGKSFESYCFNSHQLALAIDAACPIAFYSEEKMQKNNLSVPSTWQEVLSLAKNGYVVCAANATSLLMQLYMLCTTKTSEVFTENCICDPEIIKESIDEIKTLLSYVSKESFSKSPIGIYEWIGDKSKKEAYTPFDFGYSNYSRFGYSSNLVKTTNVVSYNGKILSTILGGAGIAISSKCKNVKAALDYLQFTTSDSIQKTIYVDAGGQPGHRQAWIDARVNANCNDFFKNTLQTLDNAYLRPRFNGYIELQEKIADMVRDCIINETSAVDLASSINILYKEAKGKSQ